MMNDLYQAQQQHQLASMMMRNESNTSLLLREALNASATSLGAHNQSPQLPRNPLLLQEQQQQQHLVPPSSYHQQRNYFTPTPLNTMLMLNDYNNTNNRSDSDSSLSTLISTTSVKPCDGYDNGSLRCLLTQGIRKRMRDQVMAYGGDENCGNNKRLKRTVSTVSSIPSLVASSSSFPVVGGKKQVSFSPQAPQVIQDHQEHDATDEERWWTEEELQDMQKNCSALVKQYRGNHLFLTALRMLRKLCSQSKSNKELKTVCLGLMLHCQQDGETTRGLERYILGASIRTAMRQHHAATLSSNNNKAPSSMMMLLLLQQQQPPAQQEPSAGSRTSVAFAALLGQYDAQEAACIHLTA